MIQTLPQTAGHSDLRGEDDPRRLPHRSRTAVAIRYGPLAVVSLVIVIPLVWVLLTSFKTNFSVINSPLNPLPMPFSTKAYATLVGSQEQPILRWFLNSFVAATITTALILVTASLGAYALARFRFPGRKVVFGVIVGTLFVPPVILLIPNYLIVEHLGWLDTIWAITIPHAGGAFGIFFLRQFFLGIPESLEEAAMIDGAGDWRIFISVILPLSKPALATLGVLSFLNNWNDFLWPLYVLLSPGNLTLQPGLSILQGAYGSTYYPVVMAGAVIATIPVLAIFTIAQRHIVESVAGAGLKG